MANYECHSVSRLCSLTEKSPKVCVGAIKIQNDLLHRSQSLDGSLLMHSYPNLSLLSERETQRGALTATVIQFKIQPCDSKRQASTLAVRKNTVSTKSN